jgi:GH15 family glucan-1,4-alpha-glucosidase
MAYQPIENYGIVGDMHTVALVGLDGSIDFMCFPHFDSPSIFAAILDHAKGGTFKLAPVLEDARRKQMYLPDTAILLTRHLSTQGVAEVSDFMPVEDERPTHNLVRRAKTVRGEVAFRMVCRPAFDYARADHRIQHREREILFISGGPDRTVLRLRSEVPLRVHDGAAVAEFQLGAGETAAFVLEEVVPGRASPSAAPGYVAGAFKVTQNYWHRWAGRSTYRGRWREVVHRSALTLKLMTSWDHGSLVAAPTFGLPERIGGERTWDYRYTWIRDASVPRYALIRLGYTEETGAFMRWLEARSAEMGPDDLLQVMYGLDGRRDLTEETLPHLEGYRGSAPVRIGNGAYNQLQLDIYGELMDSVYLADKYGGPISRDLWRNLSRLLDWLCENWEQPDEGIWEVRGGRKDFLYSRLMCWVALDRGLRLARKRSLPAPLGRWKHTRDRIRADIYGQFWVSDPGAFVQHKGSTALDASSLLMPLVRFIHPADPQWLSHLRAIESRLVSDSLVYRYDVEEAAPDGLAGEEGTFSICTFWYAECLSRAGDLPKARFIFEKMLSYANHLGLYAEELGPRAEHLGNFPQAFTHLALISAAYDIDRRLSGGPPARGSRPATPAAPP